MGDDRVQTKDWDAESSPRQEDRKEQQGLLKDEKDEVAADDVKVAFILEEQEALNDRYYLVYIILLIHGIGTLMPWNMFITANEYFVDFKLKVISDNVTAGEEEESKYAQYFLSSLGFVAQVPSLLLTGINLFYKSKGGNTSVRVTASLLTITMVFVFTVIMAIVDSSNWPAAFFWITMISVVVLNSANGVYQNCVYGMAANLPMKYTNAVVIGSNISGVIASFLALISKIAAPDIRMSAIFYFLTAVFVLLIALGTFFALRRIALSKDSPYANQMRPYYTHYASKAESSNAVGEASKTEESYLDQYKSVFKITWKEDLCVFFVFYVSLSCFPAIQAGVRPVSEHFFISGEFFTNITCFIFFNVFALLGNTLSTVCQQPGPRWIWLPILLRGLFIPFFMLCNFRPHSRHLPMLIANDYVYCFGGILMALTNGYFSSLSMMFAPRNVEPDKKGVAGMMAAFSLILGVFCGCVSTFPLIAIIENVGSYQLEHGAASSLVTTTVGPFLGADETVSQSLW